MKNNTYKTCLTNNKQNKRELLQIGVALSGNISAVFCFCFFKELTPGFLVANTFNILVLLTNTFFKDC